MKITNISGGPRGLNTKTGPVLVEPRQSVEVELDDAEKKVALGSGWFVEGDAPKTKAESDVSLAALQAQLAERDTTITDLNKAVTDRDQTIDGLKAELAGLQAPAGSAYTVKEQSAGWFAVVGADGKAVTKNLRHDDVKDFDGLSDSDKTAFIDLHKAA